MHAFPPLVWARSLLIPCRIRILACLLPCLWATAPAPAAQNGSRVATGQAVLCLYWRIGDQVYVLAEDRADDRVVYLGWGADTDPFIAAPGKVPAGVGRHELDRLAIAVELDPIGFSYQQTTQGGSWRLTWHGRLVQPIGIRQQERTAVGTPGSQQEFAVFALHDPGLLPRGLTGLRRLDLEAIHRLIANSEKLEIAGH